MTALFHARVSPQGDLDYHLDAHQRADKLRRLAGKRVEVVVREPKKQRTSDQNAYYWWLVHFIADATYETDPEQVHLGFRFRYLKISDEGGIPKARSTQDLSTKEFAQYVDKILTDAAMGEFTEGPLWVPRPGEGDAPAW